MLSRLFKRKAPAHMAMVAPIRDSLAHELIAKERHGTITQHESAMLEVWRFHKQPTKRYQFSFKHRCWFALSDYGDRLGRFDDLGGKGVHILGDNGIKYYALKSNICQQTLTMPATAHYSQWADIERIWTGEPMEESEQIPIERLTVEEFATIVGNRQKARRRKKF